MKILHNNAPVSIIVFSRFSLPDPKLIGGVSAWRRVDFEAVNGWSNLFSNWGGEDDDMSYRQASVQVTRSKNIKLKVLQIILSLNGFNINFLCLL